MLRSSITSTDHDPSLAYNIVNVKAMFEANHKEYKHFRACNNCKGSVDFMQHDCVNIVQPQGASDKLCKPHAVS